MLFSSLTFLFGFFPLLLIIYFIFKKRTIRNLILLVFSLIFYAWGEPKYIFLMLFTIFVVYLFGLLIHRYDQNQKFTKKKIAFILCIIFLICNLIFFKYIDFIFNNINMFFGLSIKQLKVILPIGISFYTFQILSYIIDLYRGKIKVQKNILSLALYVSFFPQLIAGPIVRYETVENEIGNRRESLNDIVIGIKRFIIGLSKKVIIANQMAIISDSIFNNLSSSYGTLIIWIGIISYTLQIYFDFSGYSDMAIGLGRIFGFHFLENFNYPYISKSITEFWRRWHISLSSWFKDYLYIPLGGNRVKKLKWVRNVFIVWCLTGLWHGASWNFVLWGIFYGIFLLFEKFFFNKILDKLPSFINWIYTIIIVMIGWTLFRANNLNDILYLMKNMFVYNKTDWFNILTINTTILNSFLFLIPAIIFSFPIVKIINKKYSDNIVYIVISDIVLLILLVICVILLTSSSYNPFIYFRF